MDRNVRDIRQGEDESICSDTLAAEYKGEGQHGRLSAAKRKNCRISVARSQSWTGAEESILFFLSCGITVQFCPSSERQFLLPAPVDRPLSLNPYDTIICSASVLSPISMIAS